MDNTYCILLSICALITLCFGCATDSTYSFSFLKLWDRIRPEAGIGMYDFHIGFHRHRTLQTDTDQLSICFDFFSDQYNVYRNQ